MNAGVVAIVVTYNSEISRLGELLRVLASQCTVVVIDNSTQDASVGQIQDACIQNGATLISLGDNFGIAHAQNVGIAWARERDASDILLMDDDSMPHLSFVDDLIMERKASPIQPVVISARTINAHGNDISNRAAGMLPGLTPCSELTSSGALIPAIVFDRVGLFDANLFIDCVDFEWGWRALAQGIPLVLCDRVSIKHSLGESTQFGLKIPSPIRHYYQYRNVLRMILGSRAPLRWRLSQFIKLPIKIMLIAILADRRIDRIRYMAWGLFDFISGRTGRFNH
jgi:rhamnosyltransferase